MNKICEGCDKHDGIDCTAYNTVPDVYIRLGGCPVNRKNLKREAAQKINPLKASKRGRRGR